MDTIYAVVNDRFAPETWVDSLWLTEAEAIAEAERQNADWPASGRAYNVFRWRIGVPGGCSFDDQVTGDEASPPG